MESNQITYQKLTLEEIQSTWALFEFLRLENAEVSFCDVNSKEELCQWVDNPAHLTYVALNEHQEVLAVVRGRREMTDEKKHSAFLTAATHPCARGKQMASHLTKFALEDMKKEGVLIARIYVYSDNDASLRAVKKLGFDFSGKVLMHHFNATKNIFVDDLIFHKCLR